MSRKRPKPGDWFGKGIGPYPPEARCAAFACTRHPTTRWMCKIHYQRWHRHGTTESLKGGPFCKNGHDRRVVGTVSGGKGIRTCRACRDVHYKRRATREEVKIKRRAAQRKLLAARAAGPCAPSRALPNLPKLRKTLGVSQKEFAEVSGVSETVIKDMERFPDYQPHAQTITKIVGTIARLMSQKGMLERQKMTPLHHGARGPL